MKVLKCLGGDVNPLLLVYVFFCSTYVMFSQLSHISIQVGNNWHTPDFYLNYKAVSNDDLRVTYADGSEDNRVEHYEFYVMPSIVARFHYEVKNPRKRNTSVIYSGGLGYAQTGFLIERPRAVFSISQGFAIIAGQPRDYRYNFNYLVVPLGISKYYQESGKALFFTVGGELTNYLLVSKKGEVKYEGNDSFQPNEDGRLASSRDYLLMVTFNPSIGFALGRRQKLKIAVNARGGITFLNVLRKEEALFRQYTYSEQDGIKMYEEARSVTPFYGVGLSFAYQLD